MTAEAAALPKIGHFELHMADLEDFEGWSITKMRKHFTAIAERATVGQLADFLLTGPNPALRVTDEDKPALVKEYVARRVHNLTHVQELKDSFADVLKDLK